MKTILYLITQSELGGAQKYILDLANSLKSEFRVAVAFGEQGLSGELAERLKNTEVRLFAIPALKRSISFRDDWKAFWQIRKIIKKVKPDIIHLNSTKISILGSLAGWLHKSSIFSHKSKIIYTVHGWVFNEPERQGDFYKKAEKFTARFKDKLICVSEFDRALALKEKIAPEKKLITIHNGIVPVDFLSRSEARSKLGLEADDLLVGSIGNLYKTKGYENLINATKILIDSGLKIKTVIIGDGPEKEELKNWIAQYHLEKYIILAGRLDDGASLLSAFDVYACSSVKEGLSYTLIEAMSAGLPIVATRVGGNSELIIDKKTGLLVEAGNPEELARALLKLTNDAELSKTLGLNARLKAEQEFTLEKMVAETREVYLE